MKWWDFLIHPTPFSTLTQLVASLPDEKARVIAALTLFVLSWPLAVGRHDGARLQVCADVAPRVLAYLYNSDKSGSRACCPAWTACSHTYPPARRGGVCLCSFDSCRRHSRCTQYAFKRKDLKAKNMHAGRSPPNLRWRIYELLT